MVVPRFVTPVLLIVLTTAGCASMEGATTHATPQQPNKLAGAKALAGAKLSAAAWPRVDWWKRFQDPQLDRLMNEALAGSPALRLAEARARKALAFAEKTNSALYPGVDVSMNATRQRFSGHGMVPPAFAGAWATQAGLDATLTYDLDLWGRNRAAYDSALGLAKAAEIDSFAARLSLSVNIAQAYVQLARAYMQSDIAKDTLKDREEIYRLTLDRLHAGIDSELSVKQAEAALPATRERIAQLRETIGLIRNQIAALVGQGPDRGLAIGRPTIVPPSVAKIPSRLPAELLGRRPDLIAQRWRVEAALKDIDVAKAQFYPNVNLVAFIGLQSIGLPTLLQAASRTLGAGPAMTLPIFDHTTLRANLAEKSTDYEAAVDVYNRTLVEALRDVVDQLTSFHGLEEQRRQQKLAQATAREAYKLALLRFREGIGTYLEVLTAESQLLAQRALDVDLRVRGLTLSIKLVRALGGGFTGADVPLAAASANPAQ